MAFASVLEARLLKVRDFHEAEVGARGRTGTAIGAMITPATTMRAA